MSTFNAAEFMNTSHKEANETTFIPIPDPEDGEGWDAQISELKPRAIKVQGEDRTVLDILWTILSDVVKKTTGIEKPMVKQTVWLDFTKENALDFGKGKNIQLGRVREALGQNKSGKPWKPSDMQGQVAKIVTKNDPPTDTGDIFSKVKKVLAA